MKKLKYFWNSSLCKWLLLGMLAAYVALDYWGLSLFGKNPDYLRAGTWGNWMAAIASAGSVAFALFNADLQRKRDVEAKVSAVAAWLVNKRRADNDIELCLELSNSTDTPIYSWTLEVFPQNMHLTNSADSKPLKQFSHKTEGPLLPGKNTFIVEDRALDESMTVQLTFKDRTGKIWLRKASGELTEVD